VQINPPFGYSEIVPLYKNSRVRLLKRKSAAAWPA